MDELRQRIEELEPDVKLSDKELEIRDELADKADFCNDSLKLDLNKNTLHFNFIEGKRDVLQVSSRDFNPRLTLEFPLSLNGEERNPSNFCL